MQSGRTIWACPRQVTDLGDCFFYHTMDIPGHGHVEGEWDLRGRESEYLGGVSLKGKRVLDVGAASGFISFYMETQGAEVVAYDLSDEYEGDWVPYARLGDDLYRQRFQEYKMGIKKLNNAFWLAHRANRSKARVVYGSVYEIPGEIGKVDVSVFGSVLLHVRDPFLALQNALRLTRDTVVVTDAWGSRHLRYLSWAMDKLGFHRPLTSFIPSYETCYPTVAWWALSPQLLKSFLGVLGFEKTKVTYSTYASRWGKRRNFTVVGHRTHLINDEPGHPAPWDGGR